MRRGPPRIATTNARSPPLERLRRSHARIDFTTLEQTRQLASRHQANLELRRTGVTRTLIAIEIQQSGDVDQLASTHKPVEDTCWDRAKATTW